jgi:hypothetical protein
MLSYIMFKERVDETDLTFQAAVTLETTGDSHVLTVSPPAHAGSVSIKDIWTSHRTLLVRLAVAIFFILLITLLEKLLPGKSGMIARMLSIATADNVTGTRNE